MLDSRFTVLYNGGVSGNRTDEMLADITNRVLIYKPQYCFVLGGINDILQSVTAETIISNFQQIYDVLTQNGIAVIASKILPCRGINAAQIDTYKKVNNYIQSCVYTRNNFHLVDLAKYWFDPTTGYPPANNTTTDDGTHPNTTGAFTLGKAMYEDLNNIIPKVPLFGYSNDRRTTQNTNPMMLGDAGTGLTTGYSFTNQGNTVPSKIARTDGIPGELQRLTVSAVGVSSTYFKSPSGTGIVAGDTVVAQCEVELSNVTAFKELWLYLYSNDVSNTSISTSQHMIPQYPGSYTVGNFKGVLRTLPFVVPAAHSYCISALVYNLAGTLDVGRFEIIKI